MIFLGISMVKNEADIIEEFVRHNISIFDEMYIIDNHSTDGTHEILSSLKDEGLPINIWDDLEPAYNQSDKMTAAYYRLKRERNFDYVMVIDADEFIRVNQAEEIRSRLKRQDTKYFLEWELYVPLETDNESSFVLNRIVNKAQTNDVLMKVIIPNIKRGRIKIWQGNHDIDCIGNTLREEILPFKLAHFPVRSVDQITSKTICGWFAYLMRGSQSKFSHEGFQWRFIFEKIVKDGVDIDDLSFIAYYYNNISKLTEMKDIKDKTFLNLQYDPVVKLFDKKLYSPDIMNKSLSNIILTTEDIIEKYWKSEEELADIKNQHKDNKYNSFAIKKIIRIKDFALFAIDLIRAGRYKEFIYRLMRKITGIDAYEQERINIERKHNTYRNLYSSNFKGRGKIKILYISEKRNLYFETFRYRAFNIIDGLDSSKYDAAVIFIEEIVDDTYKRTIEYADIVIVVRSRYIGRLKDVVDYYKQNGSIIGFDIDDYVFDEKVYLQKMSKNAPYIKEVYESDWAKTYRDEAKQYLDIIKIADFTTSSTAAIMEHIKKYNKSSYILPNSINRNQFNFLLEFKKRTSKNTNIIYMSGSPTHNYDFGEAESSLFKVLEENPSIKLIIVGYLELPNHYKKICKKQVIQYNMQDYLDLLKILSGASINIAPLERSVFNDCKSELKIFEAALFGIPTIASNTRSYRECIKNAHNGYIATTKEDWYFMLNRLVKDRKTREEMGNNARAELVDRFSYLNIDKRAMGIYEMMYNNKKNRKTGR